MLFLVIRFKFWNVITAMIEKRETKIADSLKEKDEALKELEIAKKEAEAVKLESKKTANLIIEDAKKVSQIEADEILNEAKYQIQKEKESALDLIDKERKSMQENIKNEIVEQPENLPTLKNKGEIAKVRSVYTDENFKTVTVPAGYAIIKDSPNTNDGMVISNVADDDLDNSKEGNQFVWIPVETQVLDVSKLDNEIDINDAISELSLIHI